MKEFNGKIQVLQSDLKAMDQNGAFLTKMEGFTAKSLEHLTDKGQLDSEKVIALAKFVTDERTKRAKEETAVKQQVADLTEQLAFTKRLHDAQAGGTVRTERDAVIVIDKTKAGPATVRLNYLVTGASWHPQYKLRAGAKDKDPVTVEYLASVEQQTGEDWTNVNLTLSTAQPLLSAAPPDLLALEVAVGAPGSSGYAVNVPPTPVIPGGQPAQAGGGAMPTATVYAKELEKQSQSLRSQAADNYRQQKAVVGGKLANDAAALEQFCDLIVSKEEIAKGDHRPGGGVLADGPSVTYHLKTKLSLPSRQDEQVLEVAKFDFTPKFYYKAVPVLTSNVYRLADLTNTSEHILLPGEATMYLGTDFVGQARLPLVAIGKPFTVGFGVDPQIQATRKLLDRSRATQGGNQVLNFKYQIMLSSYKTGPVPVQVWDRLPHAEATQTIAVSLTNPKLALSDDPLYVRDEKPKNLLRWDVTLEPKQNGEKALTIDYDYKLELDRNIGIASFNAR
jgi:hypothetical protein